MVQALIKEDNQGEVKLLMEKLLNTLMEIEQEEQIIASRCERTHYMGGSCNGPLANKRIKA